MKKILTLFILLSLTLWANAQKKINVFGHLLVTAGPAAAAQPVTVYFSSDTVGGAEFYHGEHKVMTDANGAYQAGFLVPEGINSGWIQSVISDCNGNTVSESDTYNGAPFHTIDLVYCNYTDSVTDPDSTGNGGGDSIYTIQGYVFGGDSSGTNYQYRVFLFASNPDSSSYVDSVDASGNYFVFPNPPAGSYYLKGMVIPGTDNPDNFLPTYGQQAISWQDAQLIHTPYNAEQFQYIFLLRGDENTGDGNIGGNLSYSGSSAPIANAEIVLLNQANQAIAYARTDQSGHYQFGQVNSGDYKIAVEIVGITSEIHQAQVSTALLNVTNKDFVLIGKTARLAGANGIADKVIVGRRVAVAPNPVGDNTRLEIQSTQAIVATVSVKNISGAEVMTSEVNLEKGSNSINLSTVHLVTGVYLLLVKTGQQVETLRFVK